MAATRSELGPALVPALGVFTGFKGFLGSSLFTTFLFHYVYALYGSTSPASVAASIASMNR